MSDRLSSCYYMCSSKMTTYNENGNIRSSQSIHINDNGIKDFYSKKSVIENDCEIIIKEEGNKNLAINKIKIPKIRSLWNILSRVNEEEMPKQLTDQSEIINDNDDTNKKPKTDDDNIVKNENISETNGTNCSNETK